MAKYANGVSEQKGLGIRFQAIVPLQIIGGTGVGDEACSVYAQAVGIKRGLFTLRGRGHFSDADVMDVAQLALRGLVQQTANVA